MRTNYDKEKRTGRELKTEHANYFQRRNELEDLFLNCVAEVKKDIAKRRVSQGAKMPLPHELVNIEAFTATDKKSVIENLMANENVLLFLYEKLFPKKQDPIVREMQQSDSNVFFGKKQRVRGSTSSMPS